MRAMPKIGLGAKQTDLLGRVVVTKGFNGIYLTVIIDALELHDTAMGDLTIAGDALKTYGFGEFINVSEIGFIIGGGDGATGVHDDRKGPGKEVTDRSQAIFNIGPERTHLRGVDQRGLVDDATQVLIWFHRLPEVGIRGAGDGRQRGDTPKSGNKSKTPETLTFREASFMRR